MQALVDDLRELGGAGLRIVELDRGRAEPTGPGVVRVGVHRDGPRPDVDLEAFDILLTATPDATAPWVSARDIDRALGELETSVGRHPVAAAVAAQVLRMTLRVSFEQALVLESLAYSTLLAGAEFRSWRAAHPPTSRAEEGQSRVTIAEADGVLFLTLDRPQMRNAFDAGMRDALCEALDFALAHPDALPVMVRGAGPAFSSGGDLAEFGTAEDVALAHLVRTLRAPTERAWRLRDRLTAHVHGACIGAGAEFPPAAGRVVAAPGTVFSLPEVGMGVIPGAGGTATLPRRIGRHRAAFMVLTGREVDVATARAWGLVDEVAP